MVLELWTCCKTTTCLCMISMYGLLYPSSIKGIIYTKSDLILINMSISTYAQLISVLVYIYHYYKQCRSIQHLCHILLNMMPNGCLRHFHPVCNYNSFYVTFFQAVFWISIFITRVSIIIR